MILIGRNDKKADNNNYQHTLALTAINKLSALKVIGAPKKF
jgi:hypothetical protein